MGPSTLKSNPATPKHLPIVSITGHHGNRRAVPVNHKKGFQATAGACQSLLERTLGQKKWDSSFNQLTLLDQFYHQEPGFFVFCFFDFMPVSILPFQRVTPAQSGQRA